MGVGIGIEEDAMEPTTIVVFRTWRAEPHGVLALFPTVSEGEGYVSSYEHVGQHGRADYQGCLRRTRPARPSEYSDLKAELEQRGYVLDVRLRTPA